MTKLNSEIRELSIEELNTVAGGAPFYGMRCSQNQNELIGAIANAFGSVPLVGGVLSGVVTAVGQAICS
jgi:hypothetical protein